MPDNNEWKTIPGYPDYEMTRKNDIRPIGSEENLAVGENGRVDIVGATGDIRNRGVSYLNYMTFHRESDEPQELEVSRVGDSIAQAHLLAISQSVNLPTEVCEILLKRGWTLELSVNEPAKWTQNGTIRGYNKRD